MKIKAESEISEKELENISGGQDLLGGWIYGTAHDIVHYDSSSCLTLRNAPDGDVMYRADGKPMGWQNGESVLVLPSSRTGNWIRANYCGNFGWTNANYIWY